MHNRAPFSLAQIEITSLGEVGDLAVGDGNEQYRTLAKFREHWEAYLAEPELCDFLSPAHLIFVEQPMYRDDALEEEVKEGLASWTEAPPMIIDESDAELTSLRRASS